MITQEDIEKLFVIKNEKGEIIGNLGNLEYIKYPKAFLTVETLKQRILELNKKQK
jgi:hypothetical protein